jgi:hypothetical protein
VRCELFIVSLDQASEQGFDALSYTWGDSSTVSEIFLGENAVLVRRNLMLALQHLDTTTKVLWVDAICINQMDEQERNAQVAKMRGIYAKANTVRVWLGLDSDRGDLAFSLLHDIHKLRHNEEAILNILGSAERFESLQGLSALFSRDYWRRVWVIQEVNVAQNIVVHCGPHVMQWSDMIEIQGFLCERFRTYLEDLSIKHLDLMDLVQSLLFRGPQSLLADRDPQNSRNLDLFDAMMMHRLKLSTDPRDKVYALVGLTTARDDPRFVIDYSLSTRQVYLNTADYIISKSQDLDLILMKTRGTAKVDLPTWIPNWASTGSRQAIPYRRALRRSEYSASGSRKSDAIVSRQSGILNARGICLGSMQSVGPASSMDWNDSSWGRKTFCAWYTYFRIASTTIGGGEEMLCRYLARLLLCELSEPDEGLQRALSDCLRKNCTLSDCLCFWHKARRPYVLLGADSVAKSVSEAEQWIRSVSQMLSRRRPFITSEGDMGLAERTVVDGDKVCILFGCSIPVILRKVNYHYNYISDACVVDYMHGKGIEKLTEGAFQEEMFEIH